jgi:hypothetical protein
MEKKMRYLTTFFLLALASQPVISIANDETTPTSANETNQKSAPAENTEEEDEEPECD